MTDLEVQALSNEQTERRLNRVWNLTLGTACFAGIYLLMVPLLPLMGIDTEVHDLMAEGTQEVTAAFCVTVSAYITGSAIAGRR